MTSGVGVAVALDIPIGTRFGKWETIEPPQSRRVKVRCNCGVICIQWVSNLTPQRKTNGCRKCREYPFGRKGYGYRGGKFISQALFGRWVNLANARLIPFFLTIKEAEEILESQNWQCVYTGVKLTLPSCGVDRAYNISLDRKNYQEGYNKENCQFVLKVVNIMKSTLSHENFIAVCGDVVNYARTNLEIAAAPQHTYRQIKPCSNGKQKSRKSINSYKVRRDRAKRLTAKVKNLNNLENGCGE